MTEANNVAMPKARRTGFLDLPLELRQQIYGYILPVDRIMNFPESVQWKIDKKTVAAICAVDPQVNEELEEMVFKECSAHITVTPHIEMGLPSAMEWNRFQKITILIDHYHGEMSGRHSDHYRGGVSSSRCRWAGMRELIWSLRYGRPEALPDIRISFWEAGRDAHSGDHKWFDAELCGTTLRWHGDASDCDCDCRREACRDESYHEIMRSDDEDRDSIDDLYEHWLRTTGDYKDNPVAVEILDYFLVLPPCKSAFVKPLRGFKYFSPHAVRHDSKRRVFDGDYMYDLWAALGLWLEGDRDGIELPLGVSEHNEPRLEQIAYRERNGQLYCDSGQHQRAKAYASLW